MVHFQQLHHAQVLVGLFWLILIGILYTKDIQLLCSFRWSMFRPYLRESATYIFISMIQPYNLCWFSCLLVICSNTDIPSKPTITEPLLMECQDLLILTDQCMRCGYRSIMTLVYGFFQRTRAAQNVEKPGKGHTTSKAMAPHGSSFNHLHWKFQSVIHQWRLASGVQYIKPWQFARKLSLIWSVMNCLQL